MGCWAPTPISPSSSPYVVSRWKAAMHFVSGQPFVRAFEADETNTWWGGHGATRVLETRMFPFLAPCLLLSSTPGLGQGSTGPLSRLE